MDWHRCLGWLRCPGFMPFIKQFCDGDLFGIVICDPFKWLESWPPTIGDRSLGHGGPITLSQRNPGNPGNPDKESEPAVAMAYPNRSSHHATGGTGIRLHMLSKEKVPRRFNIALKKVYHPKSSKGWFRKHHFSGVRAVQPWVVLHPQWKLTAKFSPLKISAKKAPKEDELAESSSKPSILQGRNAISFGKILDSTPQKKPSMTRLSCNDPGLQKIWGCVWSTG